MLTLRQTYSGRNNISRSWVDFAEAHRMSNLVVGWSGETFWGGALRVLYSFPAGILIYRMNGIIRSKMGFITISVLLFAAYPLYMVHYPYIWLFMSYVLKYKPGLPQMAMITTIGTLLLILLAWLILRYVDEPIRLILKKRVRAKNTH